jgi:hypothetical protein
MDQCSEYQKQADEDLAIISQINWYLLNKFARMDRRVVPLLREEYPWLFAAQQPEETSAADSNCRSR